MSCGCIFAFIEWFRGRVEAKGGGSYQAMINAALREHIESGGDSLETLLRRIIREELEADVAKSSFARPAHKPR